MQTTALRTSLGGSSRVASSTTRRPVRAPVGAGRATGLPAPVRRALA
jgi:hypothetical protein